MTPPATHWRSYRESSNTYDYSPAAEAQARNSVEQQAMLNDDQRHVEFLHRHLLKRTTVRPGHDLVGFVVVDPDLYDEYLIHVPIGDRTAEMAFTLEEL